MVPVQFKTVSEENNQILLLGLLLLKKEMHNKEKETVVLCEWNN